MQLAKNMMVCMMKLLVCSRYRYTLYTYTAGTEEVAQNFLFVSNMYIIYSNLEVLRD